MDEDDRIWMAHIRGNPVLDEHLGSVDNGSAREFRALDFLSANPGERNRVRCKLGSELGLIRAKLFRQ